MTISTVQPAQSYPQAFASLDPCSDEYDRWQVIVIPREEAWNTDWRAIVRRLNQIVGGQSGQWVKREAYQDRSAYRISDWWPCTDKPPTLAKAKLCFQQLSDEGLADVEMADCDDPIPGLLQPPTDVAVSAITATGATVTWVAPTVEPAPTSYDVLATEVGTSTVVSKVGVTGLTADLTELKAATDYSVVVVARYESQRATSDPETFTTTALPALGKPTAVAVPSGTLTATAARVTWTAATGGADSYDVVIKQGGTQVGDTKNVTNTQADITGLTAETEYTATVTAKRSADSATNAADPVTFTTVAAQVQATTSRKSSSA